MRGIVLAVIFLLLSSCNFSTGYGNSSGTPIPTPSIDRLAEPVLPENPTQYEQGRHLYWLNCMPCHGDHGQGLTDEFRSLWVEDHQDCWDSGCHGGKVDDEGFPLPRTVPAVIYPSRDRSPFSTTEDLYEYLRATHPPQRPGKLAEEEYWAITAYVLVESKQLGINQEIGPQAEASREKTILGFAAAGGILLVMGSGMLWNHLRHRSR